MIGDILRSKHLKDSLLGILVLRRWNFAGVRTSEAPVMDAARVELEVIAWRDGLKGK